MEIPLAVLKAFNFFTPPENIQTVKAPKVNAEPTQFNEPAEYCPLGCDPSRTKLAISKSGKRDKGNFVNVYYRGGKLAKPEVPLEVKQAAFWREFDELSERSNKKSNGRSSSGPRS